MKISRREKAVNYVILSFFALCAIVPLIGVLFSSILPASQNDGGFHVPTTFALGNYAAAWTQGHFATYMFSSIFVTICVVILTGLLSILAGFAFARLNFFGSNVIFFILLAGLMLPAEAFIIPLYFNLRGAGLTNTYAALILPQTAQSLAFGVFWMRNQFRTFPSEIIEAARIDGARDLRLLWQIIVPPSTPSIMTMCVLVSMWTWNEFLTPLIMITDDSKRTAPLGLAFFQGAHLTSYSLLAAAGVIVALPIVILYFVLQKRFINGMVGGISSR